MRRRAAGPAHLSRRAHPGEPAPDWARLQALALGTPGARRSDGIDLTATNPEQLGLTSPWARALAERAVALPYAPEAAGPLRAREAIARTYAGRVDGAVSPDDIVLTASTSESYSFLLHLLCDPGDAVLVPRPSYPLLPELARLADVRLLPYDLHYAGHFQLDPASLPSPTTLAQERIRAVVAVSPNNPTGHFTTRDELALLAELGVPLIIDEVFRTFVLRHDAAFGEPFQSGAPTFVLDGLSKRAALPGLKAGWIVTVGDAAFRQQVRAPFESIADTFLSVSALAQNLVGELLDRGDDPGALVRERAQQNLALLRSELAGSALTLLEPDAGWTAIVRYPALESEEYLFAELARRGVWVHPGALYELPLSPCFVLSLLGPPAELQAGITRMLELVRTT